MERTLRNQQSPVSMLMINSGAMQNTLAALPAGLQTRPVSQPVGPMDNTGTSFCKRNRKSVHHSAYQVVTADLPAVKKARQMQDSSFTAVLAYGIHLSWTSFAVAGPALLPICD